MTTETTAPETTDVVEAVKNRPYLMAEAPVNDGCDTIEMSVRAGDELATMRHEQLDSGEDEIEKATELTVYLSGDELFELAMAAGKALAAIGDRADLVELIKGLTDELGDMK